MISCLLIRVLKKGAINCMFVKHVTFVHNANDISNFFNYFAIFKVTFMQILTDALSILL